MFKYFKLEVSGGRLNGAERYYSSLGSAITSAKAIIRADKRSYQFDTYCEIFLLQKYAPLNACKCLVRVIQ